MASRDDDTWDVTEGVGITALAVAASRAAETQRHDSLFRDPFARLFLNAAGEGTWRSFFGATALLRSTS